MAPINQTIEGISIVDEQNSMHSVFIAIILVQVSAICLFLHCVVMVLIYFYLKKSKIRSDSKYNNHAAFYVLLTSASGIVVSICLLLTGLANNPVVDSQEACLVVYRVGQTFSAFFIHFVTCFYYQRVFWIKLF